MTSKDDIRADIQAVDDAKKILADAEAKLESDRLDLADAPSLTGTVDGDSAPADGDGAGAAIDPIAATGNADASQSQGDAQGQVTAPPVVAPTAPSTFVILQPGKTIPAGVAGSSANSITVPDSVTLVYCWWMNTPTISAADATHTRYYDGHATGQSFIINNATVLKFTDTPLDPTGGKAQPAVAPPRPAAVLTTLPTFPAPVDPARMSVAVTFADGSVKSFSGASATDVGDYTCSFAGIVQRHLRATDGSYTVAFRPDRNSGRIEFGFELGDILNPAPADMGAHTVEVFVDGASVGKISVARHLWLTSWAFESGVRKLVRTNVDLLAAKLCPPYARVGTRQVLPAAVKPYVIPMDTSSLILYQPTTGERDEIAVEMEVVAAYIATGDATALQSLIDMAYAGLSVPWQMREKSGAVWNWDKHPNASLYSNGLNGSEKLYPKPPNATDADRITPQGEHFPNICHIAFLLTGDRKFAEQMQMAPIFMIGGPLPRPADYHTSTESTRYWAWVTRSVFFAAQTTAMVSDPLLMPAAFFDAVKKAQLKFMRDNEVNNPDPKYSAMFSCSMNRFCMWEDDYAGETLGSMVDMDDPDAVDVFAWKARGNIIRSTPGSKWRDHPSFYYCDGGTVSIAPMQGNRGKFIVDHALHHGYPTTPPAGTNTIYQRGVHTLKMDDATGFSITAPNGRLFTGGKIGVEFSMAPTTEFVGMVFLLNADPASPPQAGDQCTIDVEPVTTMDQLADINGIALSPDGTMQTGQSGSYLGGHRAVLALAKRHGIPGAAAALDDFEARYEALYTPSWRVSFAA